MLLSDLLVHAKGTRWRTRDLKRVHESRQMKEWRDKNAYWAEMSRRCRKRGMTLDQYHAKLESQDFCCAICAKEVDPLVIDHDHTTGKNRGLLCGNCNTGIGLFKESIPVMTAAQQYIAKHSMLN